MLYCKVMELLLARVNYYFPITVVNTFGHYFVSCILLLSHSVVAVFVWEAGNIDHQS